jgi:glutamyl-tRNA synthetase
VELQMEKVRTRFAPSPTGFLHIGGARTALFAFLFARHTNGEFVLRIEDTDRTRLVEGAFEDIVESLKWIGIKWDEGPDIGGPYAPYRQSERKEIYRSNAFELIKTGHAYKCFCTPERLRLLRESSSSENQKKSDSAQGYDKHCRSLDKEKIRELEEKGVPFVIRLKIPEKEQTLFKDLIRGEIVTKNDVLEDIILLKSDGFPTYHLANVVDDHMMKITHVIRGDEWISSTPVHILLYAAFGWKQPAFAHAPVILSQEGGKLSKRHGATMLRDFIRKGYTKEALLNFLALLGWSLDDKTEFFSMGDLIKHFELQKINKAPAVFSYEKLDWFNGMYIRKMGIEQLFDLTLPYFIEGGLLKDQETEKKKEYILKILPLIQERLKFLSDAVGLTWFFFDEHFKILEKKDLIPKKLSKEDALKILDISIEKLKSIASFQIPDIENTLREMVSDLGLKIGQVFMTIRISITGTRVSPGLFETIFVLGKDRVINRLADARNIVLNMQ